MLDKARESEGKDYTFLLRVLFFGTILLLLWQAYNPIWRTHSETDVNTFQKRAVYFLEHGSWANMGYNEYQPGALWFFVATGWLSLNPNSVEVYISTLIFVNIALIFVCFAFFEKFGNRYSSGVFLLVLLASGPIILYRFELVVGLLTLFSWLLFKKNYFLLSALLLGIAIAMKIYPIILLPFLMLELIRKRKYIYTSLVALAAFFGAAMPVGLFFAKGGSAAGAIVSLSVHGLKPVNPDGLWGSIVIIWQKITGVPIQVAGGYGVNGFIPHVPFLTSELLNWAWIFFSGMLLFVIAWSFWYRGYKNPTLFFISLLTFVVFSKVLNPQYLWWAAIFYPLVPFSSYDNKIIAWLSLVIMIGALFITQFVYPIFYTDFMHWFNGQAADYSIFIVSVTRNALLLLLLLIYWRHLFARALKSTAP